MCNNAKIIRYWRQTISVDDWLAWLRASLEAGFLSNQRHTAVNQQCPVGRMIVQPFCGEPPKRCICCQFLAYHYTIRNRYHNARCLMLLLWSALWLYKRRIPPKKYSVWNRPTYTYKTYLDISWADLWTSVTLANVAGYSALSVGLFNWLHQLYQQDNCWCCHLNWGDASSLRL